MPSRRWRREVSVRIWPRSSAARSEPGSSNGTAGAGRADEDHQLAVLDVQADVVHGREAVAIGLDDVLEGDRCHRSSAFRDQPLTAPEVRPATMRRWNRSTSTTTGMVTMTAAAEMAAAGRWNWDAPVKKARAAGTGRARLVEVSEMANTKSFQAKKKARMAAVNTPGAARGTMT